MLSNIIKPSRQKQLATLPTLLLDSLPEEPSFLFCQHWYSYHIIHILLEGISLALQGPVLTGWQIKVICELQSWCPQLHNSTSRPLAVPTQVPPSAEQEVLGDCLSYCLQHTSPSSVAQTAHITLSCVFFRRAVTYYQQHIWKSPTKPFKEHGFIPASSQGIKV